MRRKGSDHKEGNNAGQYNPNNKYFDFRSENLNFAEITGYTSKLWAADEIRKISGARVDITNKWSGGIEIKLADTEVKYGTLSDPRMGVEKFLQKSDICASCSIINCSGHFGRIELVKKQYNPIYLKQIIDTLKCVCVTCSRLLTHKKALESGMFADFLQFEDGFKRLNELAKYFTSNKEFKCERNTCICEFPECNCGNDSKTKLSCSVCYNPKYACVCNKFMCSNCMNCICENVTCNINPMFLSGKAIKKNGEIQYRMEKKGEVSTFNIEEIYDILKKIPNEDAEILGFAHGSRPESMIMENIIVIAPSRRPTVYYGRRSRIDPITEHYMKLIKYNTDKDENYDKVKKILKDLFIGGDSDNNANSFSVKEASVGKTSIIRNDVLASKAKFSARTIVGIGDPNLKFGEIGVPGVFAKDLSVPMTINQNNKEECDKLLFNGKISYIIKKTTGNRLKPSVKINLEAGDIVGRHLRNGDIILLTRQPVIWQYGIMAATVKLIDEEQLLYRDNKTIKIHISYSTPLNADFDGDEINLHVPQSNEDQKEAIRLLSVQQCIINTHTGKPIMGLVIDAITSMFIMTSESYITKNEYLKFYSQIPTKKDLNTLDQRLSKNKIPMYSDLALLSALLPADFDYTTNAFSINQGIILMRKDSEEVNEVIYDGSQGALPSVNDLKLIKAQLKKLKYDDYLDNFTALKEFRSTYDNQRAIIEEQQFNDLIFLGITLKRDLAQYNEMLAKYHVVPYSGKALFSILLPANFYFVGGNIKIIDGILISGNITAKHVGSSGSIIHELFNNLEYGVDYAADFISDGTYLANYFLGLNGFTVGFSDCLENADEIKAATVKQIDMTRNVVENLMTDMSVTNSVTEKRIIKQDIINKLQENMTVGAITSKNYLTKSNNIRIMGKEEGGGAKGSGLNTARIMNNLGQQFLYGSLPKMTLTNGTRVLPVYEPGSTQLESIGYCTSSFWQGLCPSEAFFHFISSRETNLNQALRTSGFGWISRLLIHAYQDCKVVSDQSVRGARGNIFQFAFGGNGLNTDNVYSNKNERGDMLSFINLTHETEKINQKYGWVKN